MATSPARMAVPQAGADEIARPWIHRVVRAPVRSGLPCGEGVDHGFGQSAPYSTVIVVSPPVGVAVTWTRQPASRWASTT